MRDPNGPIAIADSVSDLICSTLRYRQSSHAIPKFLQVGGDGGVQLRCLGLLLAQRGGEPLHFFLERLAVVLLRFGADRPAWRKHAAVLAAIIEGWRFAEAGEGPVPRAQRDTTRRCRGFPHQLGPGGCGSTYER